MNNTEQEYDAVVAKCKDIFTKKMKDYGTAWRILRPTSITDQIFIKAKRISTLEQTDENKVGEGIVPEYIGLINYCVMGLIQLELGSTVDVEMDPDEVEERYEKLIGETKDLMLKKNHDYGEAWRDMRVSSFTDLILMKILRTKQIEDNAGKTLISEGIDANYQDIINYSVFAMILLGEAKP
ncbi:MAG: hypothetical protein CL843_10805 [Crocinitomicaceae bacterium]|nr:hypothetical protein [Crocinitomicaceae bacterium]|tara:strand:+ start:5187 stop:5732 length:546 start_codon:yes stop_codon:yes gene_type:complete